MLALISMTITLTAMTVKGRRHIETMYAMGRGFVMLNQTSKSLAIHAKALVNISRSLMFAEVSGRNNDISVLRLVILYR